MAKTPLKVAANSLVRNRDLHLLIVLIASVAFLNVLWSLLETRPPHWDMGRHLWTSLVYKQQLRTLDL